MLIVEFLTANTTMTATALATATATTTALATALASSSEDPPKFKAVPLDANELIVVSNLIGDDEGIEGGEEGAV
jgi:hypothetical protein